MFTIRRLWQPEHTKASTRRAAMLGAILASGVLVMPASGQARPVSNTTSGAPAVAKSNSGDTCNAKSNAFLVGQDVAEAQKIWDSYRLIETGANAGPAQPKRLTIVYDKATQRITSVSCG